MNIGEVVLPHGSVQIGKLLYIGSISFYCQAARLKAALHDTRTQGLLNLHKVLIIGGGSIGERHLRCFQRTGRATVVLCEPRDDVRERLRREYDLSEVYGVLSEALSASTSEALDVATVCAPAHLHVVMAKQLIERGISTLVEKPFSTSLDGCESLIESAEHTKTVAGLAYVLRCHPALRAMRKAIQSGRFGDPVQVISVSGQHFPFYRPAYRDIYYNNRATGGGAIQDALTHSANAVEWLVGPVTKLVADAQHCVLEGVDVEDTVHVMTRHDTVMGSFSLNQHQAVNESSITVVCRNGIARVEFHQCRWLSAIRPDAPWTVEEQFELERDDLFTAQANAFLDAVDGKSQPVCSLQEGLQTLKVSLGILQSLETENWVTL